MTNIFDKFFIGLSKIVNLEDMLSKVKETKEQGYYRLSFDLTSTRTDEEIPIRGSFIGILHYDGDDTGCSFKINSKNAPVLYASEISSIPQVTSKIYLTNTAQASKTLVLLVSTSPFGMSNRKLAVYNLTGDGLATSALQTTGNTSLATIATWTSDGGVTLPTGSLLAEELTNVGTTQRQFTSQSVTMSVSVIVNDMGSNTYIDIGADVAGTTVGIRCTAAGEGLTDLPVDNFNEIFCTGDNAADDGKVVAIGV